MKQRYSFNPRHTEQLSARLKVETAAQHRLTRADVFMHMIGLKQRCEI